MEIFTVEQKEQVRELLAQEPVAREIITRAKQAGIDVEAQESRLNEATNKLRKIQRAFIPEQA